MVLRFINAPRQDPVQRLLKVLELNHTLVQGQEPHPLAELHALYHLILSSVTTSSRPIVRDILAYLCFPDMLPWEMMFKGFGRPPNNSPSYFGQLLFLSVSEIYNHLTDLHSLLDIPVRDAVDKPIALLHATLSEWLTDPSCSGRFCIDARTAFLRQSLLFLGHVEEYHRGCAGITSMSRSGSLEFSDYSLRGLQSLLKICASDSPPSADLRQGLWRLMEMEIGPYPGSANYYTSPTSFNCLLDAKTKQRVLDYLIVRQSLLFIY